MLSGMLKGSQTVVNNPQTILTNYYKTHVTNLHQSIYGDTNKNKFVLQRTNVIEFYKRLEYVPDIFYAQSLVSKHDMNNHLLTFIEGINNIDNSILNNKVMIYLYSNEEQGHDPLDEKTTIDLINQRLNS